jgi:Histidine kinase-, DNA gyrase B-, and HSP90-like ATPase
MAIHQEQTIQMSGGFSKEIDAGAKQMIFDNLQKFQYQYPVKSTIREVVSNGIDSIREKQVAIDILVNGAAVEKYYEQKEGDVYKDSSFDDSYYDPKWFSPDNIVEVHYYDNGINNKHEVVIKDHGVGLSGKRLVGYFNLGYSSKRLSRFPLGKFGLGAKSPLSTNVPFYTVTSRHNGWEYAFNVYLHKVESIIPRFNLETEQENDYYQLPGTDIHVYRRQTSQKNGVEISLAAKQHHKQSYIEAVTHQLMYFNNVKLFIHEEDKVNEILVQVPIIYEDDMIVMSSKAHYNKPHILLNGVNYGVIDFKELELEDKTGDIGIKVSPEKVSVNPSREALIWDDITRETIVEAFNNVVSVAEEIVSQQLKEADFLKWCKICASASEAKSMFSSGNDFVGRLSKIVDLKGMELKYSEDSSIRYGYAMFAGIKARKFRMINEREGSKTIRKVDYGYFSVYNFSEDKPIILQSGPTSARKNKYISQILYPQGVINFQLPSRKEDGSPFTAEDVHSSDELTSLLDLMRERKRSAEAKAAVTVEMAKQRTAKLYNYIYASTDYIEYESIVVPDDYKATESEEAEIEEEITTQEAKESAEERKQLLGLTNIAVRIGGVWSQLELPSQVPSTWKNKEVFWGNKADEKLLELAIELGLGSRTAGNSDEYNKLRQDFPGFNLARSGWSYHAVEGFSENSDLRIFRVAQNNVKYYRDFAHIERFFKVVKNKTITMSDALLKWNTARILKQSIGKLQFLHNFEQISPKRAQMFKELTQFINKYHTDYYDDADSRPLVGHLDRVMDFQLFVREHPEDTEAIAAMAKAYFNPSPGVEIRDGLAVDLSLVDNLNELLDWSANIRVMFNMIKVLTHDSYLLSAEERDEILTFMHSKQCLID